MLPQNGLDPIYFHMATYALFLEAIDIEKVAIVFQYSRFQPFGVNLYICNIAEAKRGFVIVKTPITHPL